MHLYIYPLSKGGRAYILSRKWVWLTLHTTSTIVYVDDSWSASSSEDGASCQQCYSSVNRWREVVASAMFTRRAGVGSAEAWRAGENGAWIEARRFGSDSWSRSSDRWPEQEVWRLGDEVIL